MLLAIAPCFFPTHNQRQGKSRVTEHHPGAKPSSVAFTRIISQESMYLLKQTCQMGAIGSAFQKEKPKLVKVMPSVCFQSVCCSHHRSTQKHCGSHGGGLREKRPPTEQQLRTKPAGCDIHALGWGMRGLPSRPGGLHHVTGPGTGVSQD